MRAMYKRLILVFVILVVLKIMLSVFIPTPIMFEDENHYANMARSFVKDGNFVTYDQYSNQYGPLYPIILSIAYIFKDMGFVYMFFKIINALISSLIVFPGFLLAKKLLNERKAFLVSILCGVLPFSFIFSFFVMAENLFYVLVLFTLYFVYKSFKEKNLKWDFLAGIFLGLTYLTKTLGIALIFVIFILFLMKVSVSQLKKKILLYVMALIVVLPWLIRNGKIFGWKLTGLIGYAKTLGNLSSNFSFTLMSYWILIYLAYLILATGVIIFVFGLIFKKNKLFSALTWVTLFCFVVISAIYASHYAGDGWFVGRPMGRYVASCIPLLLILCFANIKFKESFYKNKLKYSLVCAFLILISFKLFGFHLFPVNTISLSYIGLFNVALKYIISSQTYRIIIAVGLFTLLPFYLLLVKYVRFKKLFYFVGLFFILINIIAFGMIYYNSNYRWLHIEPTQIGLWFNDNIEDTNSRVVFDIRDIERDDTYVGGKDMEDSLKVVERPITRGAFWMNAYVSKGDVTEDVDYIVTKHDLPHELLKEVGNLKLYKK